MANCSDSFPSTEVFYAGKCSLQHVYLSLARACDANEALDTRVNQIGLSVAFSKFGVVIM